MGRKPTPSAPTITIDIVPIAIQRPRFTAAAEPASAAREATPASGAASDDEIGESLDILNGACALLAKCAHWRQGRGVKGNELLGSEKKEGEEEERKGSEERERTRLKRGRRRRRHGATEAAASKLADGPPPKLAT